MTRRRPQKAALRVLDAQAEEIERLREANRTLNYERILAQAEASRLKALLDSLTTPPLNTTDMGRIRNG